MSAPHSNDMRAPRRTILKIVLSVFIAYHLAAVTILPNGSSMIGRKLAWLFLPYANPLLFNRTWQFFSPGPMSAFYLEYTLVTNDGPAADEARGTFVYPPHRQNAALDDFYMRTLAGMRLIAMQTAPFENDFVPFLCRLHPEAVALDLRSVLEELPPIEKSEPFQTFKDMSERTVLPRKLYQCPGRSFSGERPTDPGDQDDPGLRNDDD